MFVRATCFSCIDFLDIDGLKSTLRWEIKTCSVFETERLRHTRAVRESRSREKEQMPPFGTGTELRIGLSRPRTARDVAHARKRVQRRRPRVLRTFFLAGPSKTRRKAFPAVPRAPIASRAPFWSPVPHLMSSASSHLPRYRAVFEKFTTIHLSPWHAEHDSGLRFAWVDVFMLHIGCSRLSPLC